MSDGYAIDPTRVDFLLAFRPALRPIYSGGSNVCGRCFRRDKPETESELSISLSRW